MHDLVIIAFAFVASGTLQMTCNGTKKDRRGASVSCTYSPLQFWGSFYNAFLN